jgi:hypothetical protein
VTPATIYVSPVGHWLLSGMGAAVHLLMWPVLALIVLFAVSMAVIVWKARDD